MARRTNAPANKNGEATIVIKMTLTSIVKADNGKLERAADAEVERINKAIAKLSLDNVAVSSSKTFLRDE